MVSQEGIEKAIEDIETLKEELKATKQELADLKVDHAETVKQTKQTLLELRQLVAVLKINADCSDFRGIILQKSLVNQSSLITQLLLDAKEAKHKVASSSKPMAVAGGFFEKWHKNFQDLHIGVIEG